MAESYAVPSARKHTSLIIFLLLVLVLLLGAYLRAAGLFWGEYSYMHPDERFLIWVGTDISPVEQLADYWDAANSSLNPHNRGHGFYVYGTLPMFLARYTVDWIYGHSGFMEMTNIGRTLSAIADLATVLLVFLVGARAYDRRVGLLAAAFSAFAVLQIQQAHFFTMDTFTTFFALLAIYFALGVMKERYVEQGSRGARELWERNSIEVVSNDAEVAPEIPAEALRIAQAPAGNVQTTAHFTSYAGRFISQPLFVLSLGFGLALGMAVASKINAAPLALLLPLAMFIRLSGLPAQEQRRAVYEAIVYLALAALASLVAFRIFQPYAFSGPGFFDLRPNQAWLANLKELRAQSSGDVDFPPALQWARRPVWFAWKNMVLWGMGLPLGLLAWAGFLWAGWRILKGEWRQHLLLWGWTGSYFAWQSLVFNPSMRYQLLVYPTLAIFAAWTVVRLYDAGRRNGGGAARLLALLLGAAVLLATAAYAFAFTNIYLRPFTRVAASRWIYQNIPGPINLHIQSEAGVYNQPLSFPYEHLITPEMPYVNSFTAQASGAVSEIQLGSVIDPRSNFGKKNFQLTVSAEPEGGGPLATGTLPVDLSPQAEPAAFNGAFILNQPFILEQGQDYTLHLGLFPGQGAVVVSGELNLAIQTGADINQAMENNQVVSQRVPLSEALVGSIRPYLANFTAETTGVLTEIHLNAVQDQETSPGEKTLNVILSDEPDGDPSLASASINADLLGKGGLDQGSYTLSLSRPVSLVEGGSYFLILDLESQGGALTLQGSNIANEGAWDDGLPLRLDGYDGYGGVYTPGLNFDMYEDDNPNKRERFYYTLDTAEYILITSSRQWGTLPRLPERFPMNTEYYRNLIGCPPGREIEWCYNVAQPGDFQGNLGFDLIQVFQSNPALGPFSLNDQPAEEAFTVYDHPKVFIFQKRPDYDPGQVRAILGSVDLDQVVHLTPRGADRLDRERLMQRWFPFLGGEAAAPRREMLLPAGRLESQRAGGTWSELFNTQAWHNRWPGLGAIVWYLAVAFLGLATYPLLRFALPGLPDRGYPLARTAGLLLVSYLVWLMGSFQLPFTRFIISGVVALVALAGLALAFLQRDDLRREWRVRRRYFLIVEGLFLAFFLFDLLIRLGNPDLWHPWKGGERPMDFSYFNAVLKSTSFPPYDPWFTGGYINYYYYGFVFVGFLVKWLGIVPAIAYNLILPTIFSLIALGAFSVGWNLYQAGRSHQRSDREKGGPAVQPVPTSRRHAWLVGLAAALGMAVLGNLATLRMVYQGYQRLAAPGGNIEGASILTRWIWAAKGMFTALLGTPLPFGLADWYWNPSRAIPAPNDIEPITEFPFFTVLYGDPHAHLFALPLTLLALSWALSVILGRAWEPLRPGSERRSVLQVGLGFLIGGLAIGSLFPTNTWDLPTYLAFGMLAVGYAVWRTVCSETVFLGRLSHRTRRAMLALAGIALITGLSFVLFQPYAAWYVQGYTDFDIWKGTHTPFWSYLTHWGLFLFVILSWMVWETRDWMASTPLSALAKLAPYRGVLYAGLVMLAGWILILMSVYEVAIAWLVLPLAVWAGVLLLRPGQPDPKRAVLFLVGTGLVLTLMVEVIVLVGDIGRMNTVFKFYLQVWTLFAVSAAAALGWLLPALPGWLPSWRSVWQAALTGLVAAAALYPLLGTTAKIKDRMAPEAPHTLDGMAYMQYATFNDLNTLMDLSQDYRAIRWMQENVTGSPVIVEANMVEYHWGTRYTVYTGLPNVIGWNWHQRQQRARSPENAVPERVEAVTGFYLGNDLIQTQDFLNKYDVQYIIVGQLERAFYNGPGLDKFEQLDGSLWREVYREGETVIYEVIKE